MERWTAIIADEDVAATELIARSLSPLRYDIVTVDNADDITATAAQQRAALVLASLSLPGLDPEQLCRKLNESAGYAYVTFLLEQHDADAIETAFATGADDAIAKPLIAVELRARLQHASRVLALEDFRAELEGEGALFAEISARANFHSRRYLEIQLDSEIARARRFAHSLALVLAEVQAKRAGDRLMRTLGHLLSERFRARVDWVARYDESKFAFVLPETDLTGAVTATRRLLAELSDDAVLTSTGLPAELTINFGVSVLDRTRLPSHASPEPQTLFDAAEAYLEDAARKGQSAIAAGPVPYP